jgi:hypothetical protein
MRGKVMQHFMLQPVMQGHQQCCQCDHKSKVLPGLPIGDGIDIFLNTRNTNSNNIRKTKKLMAFIKPSRDP